MRILHLIGNGLDLSYGLKTSYADFYKTYTDEANCATDSATIQKLKSNIRADYKSWADAELALGKYAEQCESMSEYTECIDDFRDNLREYLKQQLNVNIEGPISPKQANTFCNHIITPAEKLDEAIRSKHYSLVGGMNAYLNGTIIDVISFNYTHVFEYLVELAKMSVAKMSGAARDTFNELKIHHIHGTLEDSMTLGVNDSSQVKAKFSISEDDYVEIVKPLFNDACLNLNNSTCENLIAKANIICLFGLSLGETDKKWWELIGVQMMQREDVSILFFPFDPEKDTLRKPQMRSRWSKYYQEEILRKCMITGSLEQYKDRILVGLNKDLFKV